MRGRINVGWLLSMLEDPFEIFPLQSIGDELARSVAVSKEALYSKMGPWGVSRKYWTVEEEHCQAEISLLVGASFVLVNSLSRSLSPLSSV